MVNTKMVNLQKCFIQSIFGFVKVICLLPSDFGPCHFLTTISKCNMNAIHINYQAFDIFLYIFNLWFLNKNNFSGY